VLSIKIEREIIAMDKHILKAIGISMLVVLASVLMILAHRMVPNGLHSSAVFIGEPELPQKFKK